MSYRVVEEHSVGEGVVGDIERLYRCDNDYGLIVVIGSPGSEAPGRMTVTPVVYEGEGEESYRVLSAKTELREGLGGELLEPRALDDEADLDRLLAELCELAPYEPDEDEPIL